MCLRSLDKNMSNLVNTTNQPAKISLFTATSIVVANMIGTGVFTSLGFQAEQIRSPFALILLWLVGGVFALCGALSYGELAAAMPRSGGEFNYLSRIYHPAVGLVAGWTSITVGFAAPIALAAMAFGKYFVAGMPGTSAEIASCAVVILVSLAHLRNLQTGSMFQNAFTTIKVLLILTILIAGFLVANPQPLNFTPVPSDLGVIVSAPFSVSLIYVMYAYSGWNASTYIAGEIRDPERNLPRSLFIGTLIVLILYVGLNAVFLYTTPIPELAGKLEVGAIAAKHIFGEAGGRLFSGLICVSLISCISAMTWAGPRVLQVMGEDFVLLKFLSAKTPSGIPVTAILLQLIVVLVLILTSTFQKVLIYTIFTLNLCTFLVVLGVIYLRFKSPELPRPYRTWGYPVTPIIFLVICFATMVFNLKENPVESIAGLATLLAGLVIYFVSPKRE